MTVQERASQRSVAQRIAELRRLHEVGSATPWNSCDGIHTGFSGVGSRGSILGEFGLPEDATLAIATRNLLPVLLASWEFAAAVENAEQARESYHACSPADYRKLAALNKAATEEEAARQAYREALKGLHDA